VPQFDASRVDLNLFSVFDALMSERSVTRAAARLNLSQSAVSHSLARLRVITKDELFIRSSGEMRPTSRASELWRPIQSALTEIRKAISQTEFEPASASVTFKIAMTGYAATTLADRLFDDVQKEAPNCALEIEIVGRDLERTFMLLDDQKADLFVGICSEPPGRLGYEALFSESFSCILRPGHALAGATLTAKEYADAIHLVVPLSVHGTGAVDHELAKLNLKRRVRMVVNQFALAPPIILNSDLISVVPERVARLCQERFGLAVASFPLEIPPAATRVVWHSQLGNNASNRWIRSLLRRIV
jgi:DNA-binding transcriptional LysR family regulator